MKLQQKAPLSVVAVALITAALSAWSSYSSNARLIESSKIREMQTTATVIQNSLQNEINKSASQATLIASLPTIQKLMRAKDQQKLSDELKPAFKLQKEEFGVEEGQFFLPPAFEFLRTINKTKFMNDVSGFREMVLATNRRHENQRGLEIGRHGLGIHGLAVIQDAQGPTGAFDVGLYFDSVLQEVKKISGGDAGLFIDDKLVTRFATLAPAVDAEHMVGSFRNMEATNWTALKPLVSSDMFSKADVSYTFPRIKDVSYGIVSVPLNDFKGVKIGYFVAVKSFEAYENQMASSLVTSIVLAGFQAMLLCAAILLAFNGLLMRPFNRMGVMLAHLAKGKVDLQVGDLVHRKDEVGDMAKSLEEIRQSLAAKQNSAS